MGLRNGGFASIWAVEPEERFTKVRLSTSKKNQDGNYEQDFGGYVRFIGEAHKKAGSLKEKDRIKIGEFEVTNSFNAEKKVTYTNVAVFSFEMADGAKTAPSTSKPASAAAPAKAAKKPAKKTEEDAPDDDPF